jgi:hypothetical protein
MAKFTVLVLDAKGRPHSRYTGSRSALVRVVAKASELGLRPGPIDPVPAAAPADPQEVR